MERDVSTPQLYARPWSAASFYFFFTRNFPMFCVVVVVGTTLFECKSGYGLTAEAELKMLRVMENSRDRITADVSVTYCAAHAVPE